MPNPDSISVFLIVSILAVLCCHWFIDQSWNSPIAGLGNENISYSDSENDTADMLASVNQTSSVGRVALFSWAMLCFATGQRALNWNSNYFIWTMILGSFIYGSVLWSVNPKYSVYKLLVFTMLALTSLAIAKRFTLRNILNLFCGVFLALAVLGVAAELYYGVFRPWRQDYRFVGTSHANLLAINGAIICLSSRMYFVKDHSKLIGVLLLTIGSAIIVMTKSRTTLGAAVVAMLAMQLMTVRGNNRIPLIAAFGFVVGLASIASLFLSQQATGILGNVVSMGRSEEVTSLTGRLPLWEELITWVNKKPFLGYGYLAFWDAKMVEKLSETFQWVIPHGHNMYLDIMLDIGLIGLVVYLIWFGSAMFTAYRQFMKCDQVEFAIVFGIGIFALINGFGESLFKLPTIHLFVLLTCFFSLLFGQEAPKVEKKKRLQPRFQH